MTPEATMTMLSTESRMPGGRPRKNGPREKDGRTQRQRPSQDHGTPEAQAHRLALVGSADPVLAESPVGVLLARGLITGEEAAAARAYAWLYARAVRRPYPPLVSLEALHADGGRPGLVESDDEGRVQEAFRRGKNRLLAAGRRCSDAVERVVVFGELPRFLMPGRSDRERQAVLHGIAVLAACYGRVDKRSGRA